MNRARWFIGLTSVATASFMAFGAHIPPLPDATGSALTAAASVVPAMSMPAMPDVSMANLAPGSVSQIHWPSLGIGIIAGIVLAILAQVSWKELPRRVLRWLLLNERNFYRVGMAAACIGVLLFY